MIIFVYGTLREAKVFDSVVESDGAYGKCFIGEGIVKDVRPYYVEGEVYPALKKEGGYCLSGDLLKVSSPQWWDKILHYEDPSNYEVRNISCLSLGEDWKCGVFWPKPNLILSDKPWCLENWRKIHDLDAYIRSFSTSSI